MILVKIDLVAGNPKENMTDKELDSLCDQIQDQLEMGANAILESIKVKFPNVEFWIRK